MPRNNQAPAEIAHPGQQLFEFKDMVLSWSIDAILASEEILKCIPRPPSYLIGSKAQYYSEFKPLIIAEAKAILKEGVQCYNDGKSPKSTLKVLEVKPATNGWPTTLIMDGSLSPDFDPKTEIILVVDELSKKKFIGSIGHEGNDLNVPSRSIKIKCHYSTVAFVGSKFALYPLGSLVTVNRAYDACIKQTTLPFENNFVSAVPHLSFKAREPIGFDGGTLNRPQLDAIDKFVKLDAGLLLLQGPPGTGKTTTIVQLIDRLVANGESVLVCAPSNKAVQVVVKRVIETCPEFPTIFAGREEKLCAELEGVFLDTWRFRLIRVLKSLLSKIEEKLKSLELAHKEQKTIDVELALNILEGFYEEYKGIIAQVVKYGIYNEAGLSDVTKCYDEYKRAEVKISVNVIDIFKSFKSNVDNFLLHFSCVADVESYLLRNSKVVFCTLSFAGQHRMQHIGVSALIIDEAAQTTEAETIIPFQHTPRKCLLVGDTSQLPAVVKSESERSSKINNYGWSMMHRLQVEANYPCDMLTTQYRMHEKIRKWPSMQFYQDRLEDGPEIALRAALPLPAIIQPYTFIDVDDNERARLTSRENPAEANCVIRILRFLQRTGIKVDDRVGIITFYSGQVDCINRNLQEFGIRDMRAQTVDGFQGDEKDIIIISFVRSNRHGSVGFLDDFRRLNVAVTRAKQALIMVGNRQTLSESGDVNLSSMLNYAALGGNVLKLKDVMQILWPEPDMQAKHVAGQRQQAAYTRVPQHMAPKPLAGGLARQQVGAPLTFRGLPQQRAPTHVAVTGTAQQALRSPAPGASQQPASTSTVTAELSQLVLRPPSP